MLYVAPLIGLFKILLKSPHPEVPALSRASKGAPQLQNARAMLRGFADAKHLSMSAEYCNEMMVPALKAMLTEVNAQGLS